MFKNFLFLCNQFKVLTGYILKAYNYNTDGRRDNMQDDSIVGLYWKRDETAIRETEKKYGNYLLKILMMPYRFWLVQGIKN